MKAWTLVEACEAAAAAGGADAATPMLTPTASTAAGARRRTARMCAVKWTPSPRVMPAMLPIEQERCRALAIVFDRTHQTHRVAVRVFDDRVPSAPERVVRGLLAPVAGADD